METTRTDLHEEEYREVFTRDGISQGRIVPKHAPVNEGDYFKQILVILKTKDSPAAGEGVGASEDGGQEGLGEEKGGLGAAAELEALRLYREHLTLQIGRAHV